MFLKQWLDDIAKDDTVLQHFTFLRFKKKSSVDEVRDKFQKLWYRGVFENEFYLELLNNLELINDQNLSEYPENAVDICQLWNEMVNIIKCKPSPRELIRVLRKKSKM